MIPKFFLIYQRILCSAYHPQSAACLQLILTMSLLLVSSSTSSFIYFLNIISFNLLFFVSFHLTFPNQAHWTFWNKKDRNKIFSTISQSLKPMQITSIINSEVNLPFIKRKDLFLFNTKGKVSPLAIYIIITIYSSLLPWPKIIKLNSNKRMDVFIKEIL